MSYEDLPLFAEPAPESQPQVQIVCDDVLVWAEKYDGPPFHAMLTDAPYHLISDTRNGSQRQPGTGPYGRHTISTKGFMGKEWDGNDISFRPDTWKALAQHLLPGAFIMAFASARGYHRLACALEDAGLVLHPAVGWLYGSGFPKATRIDTQVDLYNGLAHVHELNTEIARARAESGLSLHDIGVKMLEVTEGQYGTWYHRGGFKFFETGVTLPSRPEWQWLRQVLPIHSTFEHVYDAAEREVIGQETKARKTDCGIALPTTGETEYQTWDVTAPATPLAQIWAGHRYGLQALKPALEFIAVAQKPYQDKPVQSITQTGAGALNIDASRLSTHENTARPSGVHALGLMNDDGWEPRNGINGGHPSGRWPANFALCHSHLPDEPCQAESCPVAALDAQAGERQAGGAKDCRGQKHGFMSQRTSVREQTYDSYGDTGGPSRFFHVSDYYLDIAERLAQADPVFYCAKASRRERDAGLFHDPQSRQSALGEYKVRQCNVCSSRHKDSGPATRHLACGHSDWSWVEMTQAGSRGGAARNPHPTVKPLTLCKWLATLLLPPAEYAHRRLLVPFAGVASEGIGAMLAGWDEIVMIDSDQSYVDIARQRVAYWQQRGQL